MKKTVFFAISLVFLMTLIFSSCIQSHYFEDWESDVGYVVTNTIQSSDGTTKPKEIFIGFVSGDKPDGETVAVCYSHSYITSSPYCTIEVQKVGNDITQNIANEYLTEKQESFYIRDINNVKEYSGFFVYRDRDFIYVINDNFKNGYYNYMGNGKGDVRYKITITGMRTLYIEMEK